MTGGGPSITNATYKAEWTFDELGNWTEFKTSTNNGQSWTTQTRQHNDANEVDDDNDHSDPPSATAISNWKDPEFDANGSATKAPIPGSEAVAEHEYVFDAFDRMVAVKQAGEVIAEYRYDGLGRRTRKFAKQSATTNWDVWEYYYGAGWQVVQVRKDTVDRGSNPTTDPVLSTTLKEEYLYHPVYIDAIALRVRDTDSDGDIDELDDPEYYTQDANMNVTALLDASGAVLERYDYDAYGKVTFLDASFQNPSGTSSHDNDILFAGRRLDLETQLYHFRLRQYHPTLGRFVSRDPIGVWGDPGNAGNAYAYVGGNPVNGLDPMGLADMDMWSRTNSDNVDWLTPTARAGMNNGSGIGERLAGVREGLRDLAADVAKEAGETLALHAVSAGSGPALKFAHRQVKRWRAAAKAAETAEDLAHARENLRKYREYRDALKKHRRKKSCVAASARLGDDLAEAASWVKPQKGVFDVVVHGSSDAFHVLHNGKWVKMNHRSLATFMKKQGYSGGPVRLLSCGTGSCPTGVAQNLSNKIGAEVTAPSDTLWIHRNGNLTIGNSPTSNTGVWNTFTPGK